MNMARGAAAGVVGKRRRDFTVAAPLKSLDVTRELGERIRGLGQRARSAARALALAPIERKDAALASMADALRGQTREILAANAQDLAEAKASGTTPAFLDRLALDEKRIGAMIAGLDVVRGLPDPVGAVTE